MIEGLNYGGRYKILEDTPPGKWHICSTDLSESDSNCGFFENSLNKNLRQSSQVIIRGDELLMHTKSLIDFMRSLS